MRIQEIFRPSDEILSIDPERADREELTEWLQEEALALYDHREQELGSFAEGEDEQPLIRALERFLLLQIIDQRWREHLHDMDYLREGIHLRGLAQIDPLVAYKNEGFTLFGDLMKMLWHDFARMIYHVQVTVQDGPPPGPGGRRSHSRRPGTLAEPDLEFLDRWRPCQLHRWRRAGRRAGAGRGRGRERPAVARRAAARLEAGDRSVQQRHADANEPGRNDPCWCGSGKKYKRCHGA